MADVLFIVNPASGAGKAGRDWVGIANWLTQTGLAFEAALTTRPLEASEIAARAVRESRPVVVAVGGDGTLNEVVNGFFHNGAPIPTTSRLAMLPLGTGGDFRRTLRIPLDYKAAIEVIMSGTPRRLDAGCVTFQADDAPAKLLDLCHGAGQIVRGGQLIRHGRDGLADVCGNDVGARCCQRECVRASLPASSTGDQRHSTGDVGHTLPTSCVKS